VRDAGKGIGRAACEAVPDRVLSWAAVVLALSCLLVPGRSSAEDVEVPTSLQAELLAKVAEYDRNFQARAQGRALVLLVVKPGSADSARVAAQMETSFSRIDHIAGLPHDEEIVSYAGAIELAATCRSRHVAVVFFGPGFRDDVEAIRRALEGVDVLSAAGVADYVPLGIVFGSEVVSGRPRLLIHLTQARLQNVDIRAEALKLMKVFQ
jgi:hypothetical protein